ncbi:hypothetical protein Tco_0656928 [Tanacetum coccineum]|uniref:Retrotransposon gag domain-containing protein n=1 Tax=Tanacetum coccineum TaxID=301880 RepID=A0ABQ4XAA0_9ASTR
MILTTNTPYPSRKIRRIRACTHQRPQRKEDQYAVSREDQYAVLDIWHVNILEDIKRGPYSKKPQYAVSNPLDTPMDDMYITMEEYIRLEEEKAKKHRKVFNWETAKYGKIWYDEDIHDLRSVETEFPAIAFNDELIEEGTTRSHGEPILYDNMEKAPTESNLSITSNDINIELSKEFLVELRKNIYHGTYNEDVVDHIAKVLKMVDLIYVPGVDSHQLRMKVFPLSLADDAKEWWISEGDGKITTWEELVETFFCRFYPESYDGEDEMLDEGDNWGIDPIEFLSNVNTSFKNHKKVDGRTKKVLFHAWMNGNWNKRRIDDSILRSNNTTTDSFFKPYLITHGKSDTEKEDEQSQTKRKYSNTSNSIDEQPNKRRCKAEKFEAIQYSLGPNKEYIAIRGYEFDIWERNDDNLSIIYQDIFLLKDEGWKVTRTKTLEAKNIDEYWWRIYKSGDLEVLES